MNSTREYIEQTIAKSGHRVALHLGSWAESNYHTVKTCMLLTVT